MDTFDAIYKRRAVKHYDPAHVMPAADLGKIIDAAMQSPTAFNIQHWRLVNVEDKALRQQIREVAWNQAQVTDSSVLLILCADADAWKKNPARYWAEAPKEVQDFLVPAIETYYKGHDQVQRDETMRSCGLVGQTIMLAAKALGYDSCPMDGFDYEAVGKLIQLPKDHVISFMISIGKVPKEAWPKPGQLPKAEVLIKDRFQA